MDGSADPDMWGIVIGALGMAATAAVLLTWPLSALLLSRYRRSVENGMRRTAAPRQADGCRVQPDSSGSPHRHGSAPYVEVVAVGSSSQQILVERARARSRRAQVAFAVAGLAFGVVSAIAFLEVADDTQSSIRHVITLTPLVAWLTVPTLLAIGVQSQRSRVGLVAGHLGLVILALLVGGSLRIVEVLMLLVVQVLLPALFIIATSARGVRGAAWLVAPWLFLLGLTVVPLYTLWAHVTYNLELDGAAVLLMAVVAGLAVLGLGYGFGVAYVYGAGWASDETLRLVQWWFVLAIFQALILGVAGPAAALLGLLPVVVFVAVLAGAFVLSRRPQEPPARLLLLRTFGARRRSTRLLRDLTLRWRWVGSVELIAGVDLASETVEPDEFLTFLRGRLASRFVRHAAEAEHAIAGLATAPAYDGRYGVHELFCHDDTWRPVLRALIDHVDAVLIDLRGLRSIGSASCTN